MTAKRIHITDESGPDEKLHVSDEELETLVIGNHKLTVLKEKRTGFDDVVGCTSVVPVCDFCLGPDPAWTYPCGDFMYEDAPEPFMGWSSVVHGSRGPWGACETCHQVIEEQGLVGITARSVEVLAELIGSDQEAAREVASHQALFFKHRQGPAVRSG